MSDTKTIARLALDYTAEHPAAAGPLVRSYRNPHRGLSPGYVSDLVRGLFREAGVKEAPLDGRSAHALRHTMAGDVLRRGAHLRRVAVVAAPKRMFTAPPPPLPP